MTLLLNNEEVETGTDSRGNDRGNRKRLSRASGRRSVQPAAQSSLSACGIEDESGISISFQIAGRRQSRNRRLGAADYLRYGGPFFYCRRQTKAYPSCCYRQSLLRAGHTLRHRAHRTDRHHARWRDPETSRCGAFCCRRQIPGAASPEKCSDYSAAAGRREPIWNICAASTISIRSKCSVRMKNTVDRFAESMARKLGRHVVAAQSARETVEGSDIVQAATASWDAVFDGHWVEKGMYVASIGGSDASNKRREIDDETIARADLYVVHSKEVARLDQSPDIWEVAQRESSPGARFKRSRICLPAR